MKTVFLKSAPYALILHFLGGCSSSIGPVKVESASYTGFFYPLKENFVGADPRCPSDSRFLIYSVEADFLDLMEARQVLSRAIYKDQGYQGFSLPEDRSGDPSVPISERRIVYRMIVPRNCGDRHHESVRTDPIEERLTRQLSHKEPLQAPSASPRASSEMMPSLMRSESPGLKASTPE